MAFLCQSGAFGFSKCNLEITICHLVQILLLQHPQAMIIIHKVITGIDGSILFCNQCTSTGLSHPAEACLSPCHDARCFRKELHIYFPQIVSHPFIKNVDQKLSITFRGNRFFTKGSIQLLYYDRYKLAPSAAGLFDRAVDIQRILAGLGIDRTKDVRLNTKRTQPLDRAKDPGLRSAAFQIVPVLIVHSGGTVKAHAYIKLVFFQEPAPQIVHHKAVRLQIVPDLPA